MYRCIIYVQSCVLHVQRLFSWTVIPRHLNWSASHSDEIPWGVGFSWLWHMKIYENITKNTHTQNKNIQKLYTHMFIYVHGAKCSLKHPKKTNACHNAMPSGCRRSSFSCWIHKFLSCVATGSDVFVGFSLDPKWHHVCVWIYIYIYYTYSCWSQCRNDLWMYIFVF